MKQKIGCAFGNTGELLIFLTVHPEFQNRVVIQNTDKGISPFIFKKLSDEKVFIETELEDNAFSWENCHENASRAAEMPVTGPTGDVPGYSIVSDERIKQLWHIAEREKAKFAKMHLKTDAAQYNPLFDLRYVGRGGNRTSVKVITKSNVLGEYEPDQPSIFIKILEKSCESERHAELEEKVLQGLKKRGRNVVKLYGRD
ncbi:hypothetical protein GF343_04385 [Candidatus Woesearchaeota archaeon]|nr:hypothetical protein [Candidatus Woesearchaeota archaeon]